MDKSACCRSTVRGRPQFCRNADHVLTLKRQFRCWVLSPGDRACRISNYTPSGDTDGIQTRVVAARPPPQFPLELAGTTFRVDRTTTTLWVEFASQRRSLTRLGAVTERFLRDSGAEPAGDVVVPFDELRSGPRGTTTRCVDPDTAQHGTLDVKHRELSLYNLCTDLPHRGAWQRYCKFRRRTTTSQSDVAAKRFGNATGHEQT